MSEQEDPDRLATIAKRLGLGPRRCSTREIVMDHLGKAIFESRSTLWGPQNLGHNPSWVKAADYDLLAEDRDAWRLQSRLDSVVIMNQVRAHDVLTQERDTFQQRIVAMETERDRLRNAVMLAIVNIDCDRNGLTPDGNVRDRLLYVLNTEATST